jgi:sigma-54 dependent transcriptional regulator, acetoin dehydrogenase operon transcriptional activator AcoR
MNEPLDSASEGGDRPWAEVQQMFYDEHKTMDAWADFLGGGPASERQQSVVRSIIQNSWRRSLQGGIDANGSAAPLYEDREKINDLIRKNADVIAAARPCFAMVSKMVEGTGAMIVLTDGDGVLLEALGDRATLRNATDIHLTVGGMWDECSAGTNGIGTALATGEPVFVHAAEHFCAGIKGWTCAGAPIRDPLDGSAIGVFDLSGLSAIFRPHNTFFAAAIAREIEQELALRQREERTRLLEAFIASSPGYGSRDGLVIVDRLGRATYVNNMPTGADGRGEMGPLVAYGEKILDGPLTDLTKAQGSAFPDALLRVCNFRPLRLDGEIRGAALVFPSSPSAARTSRPVSSSAPRARVADGIVGECEALRAAVDVARRVARSGPEIAILIEGETGVGKELFARLVHHESDRRQKPFVALNCGAITRELFGSEIFGHVGGAFTGSSKDGKVGVFELADGGVLSLDEISEMPLDIQPFLLRVLEERMVRRIGDTRERPVDVRLIASTNRDLRKDIAAGRFRSDLFYRISMVSIRIPPLRERRDDIPLLVAHYTEKLAVQTGRPLLEFTPDAIDALKAYRWPGNVRELRNLVSRLCLLASTPLVRLEDLPEDVRGEPLQPCTVVQMASLRDEVEQAQGLGSAERQMVMDALVAEQGNLSRVAQRLGISRPTLYRKIQLYGIQARRSYS